MIKSLVRNCNSIVYTKNYSVLGNSLTGLFQKINNNTGIRYFSIEDEYQNEISYILKGYEDKKERKQSLIGYIVSTKCKKSILVRIEHQKYLTKYNKYINLHEKVMAHDDNEIGKLGDLVRIIPCRPMSKRKRHCLKDIIKKAQNIAELLSDNNDNNNIKKQEDNNSATTTTTTTAAV